MKGAIMNDDNFKMMSGMFAMGNLMFGGDAKNANAFKVRMLKASYGDAIMLPDNWDELDEAEKTKRLEAIEQVMREG
jgi:hypothetical protein